MNIKAVALELTSIAPCVDGPGGTKSKRIKSTSLLSQGAQSDSLACLWSRRRSEDGHLMWAGHPQACSATRTILPGGTSAGKQL